MDLKANTLSPETNSIDVPMEQGYSLKRYTFYKWARDKHLRLSYIAKRLGMPKEELIRKLDFKMKFNEKELTELVYMMGASTAINVIYFPDLEFKKEVIKKTFKKKRKKKVDIDERKEDVGTE